MPIDVILVWGMFKQPCWWDFTGVAFDISRRYTISHQTPWSTGSSNLFTPPLQCSWSLRKRTELLAHTFNLSPTVYTAYHFTVVGVLYLCVFMMCALYMCVYCMTKSMNVCMSVSMPKCRHAHAVGPLYRSEDLGCQASRCLTIVVTWLPGPWTSEGFSYLIIGALGL